MRLREHPTPNGALASRLGRAGERSFVGRAGERELLAAALAADEPPFAVLFLHGPGGIGKSALLRRLCLDAEAAGALAVLVDGRTVGGTPAGFTAAVAAQLGLERGEDPVPALGDGPRPVLLVDTFEQCSGLQGWLRDDLLPRLPASALTVIAGREPPEAGWRFDPAWHDMLRVVALRNLPPDDAGHLLSARGVPAEAHARVLAFTGGHPLALCLVAELCRAPGDPEAVLRPGTPDVVRALLERFVDDVPSPRHRAALEVCAHVRVTTESLLRAVLDDAAAGELFGWLRGRSFVEEGGEGLFPHDLARDVLDAELRWRDPDRYVSLHRRIRDYLVPRLHVPDPDPTRAWRDLMFLHRNNPAFGPFLSSETEISVYEDRAGPADESAVLRMTDEEEGPQSAALLRHWLDRQPDALRVYRRPGRPEPVGCSMWLRVTEPEAGDLADPLIARIWQHVASTGGLRRGEHVGVLRTFVVPGAYHRPSPAMDLVQVRAAMEWTSPTGPALSVLPIAEGELWAPQMAYIDHARFGEVTVGRRTFTLFAHDWRTSPPEAWLRLMAAHELSGGTDAAPGRDLAPPRQVLSQPEFEATVKDALRCWRRPAELARNPLCRTRVVADGGGGPPAERLSDLLVEATDTLATDPRDAKLHRAVATTYFRGVLTQEAAAERLGLPFSTYRRHLTAGVARLTAWLWERELHGTEQGVSTDRPVG